MLGGEMRFWTNCFFSCNIFFLPKKKSKRCERNTKSLNKQGFKLHRPSSKGTKLFSVKIIKAIIIISQAWCTSVADSRAVSHRHCRTSRTTISNPAVSLFLARFLSRALSFSLLISLPLSVSPPSSRSLSLPVSVCRLFSWRAVRVYHPPNCCTTL